jgi:hypothetical protein
MNDFTKDELIILKNGLECLPIARNLSMGYMATCIVLKDKLNSMIENYCDHDGEIGKDYPAEKCMKCGAYWE